MNLENNKIDVFSTEHKRTFCYIKDAVEIIYELTKSDESIGCIFNIGNQDEEISMGDLATKLVKLIGKKLLINPLPDTPGSPKKEIAQHEK